MITAETIEKLIEQQIAGKDIFLVEVIVKPGNTIQVHVDRPEGISINECVRLSRFLNGELDREVEDYSLEVSSPGLTKPFIVKKQYDKNLGREIEVLLQDGKKLKGPLKKVSDSGIMMQVRQKAASEGSQKKKKLILVEREVKFEEIKTAKPIISFK